jgi:hypothetical protein
VLPGISESEAISPVTSAGFNWDMRTSLGRAGTGLLQQWGLPCHYFAGFRGREVAELQDTSDVARAFCCGLTDLPGADLYVEQRGAGVKARPVEFSLFLRVGTTLRSP